MRVIGTAGHVDHGKSTLIQALTGTHPDRLKEERERQMTIDLGFAWWVLPGGEEIGVVDVPGHRDFISNMLSGIGSIDAVILVIAADEGVMPQTREHLAILDLLHIDAGVVALTKIDMVDDPSWIELVSQDIRQVLAGTSLETAAIVPVSSKSGQGLEMLQELLGEVLRQKAPRPDKERPRLSVDRIFSMTGFGAVTTGTLLDGQFRVGDEVQIFPTGQEARIRGLQSHKRKIEIALPGSRTAVNLSGIESRYIQRGHILTHPGAYQPTRRIDARLSLLADSSFALRHNTELKMYLAAAEVIARARVLGAKEIAPGEKGWVQLELREPVIAVRGDRFIVRRPSPGETIGGGRVVDPHPAGRHKRFARDTIHRLETLSAGTPADIFLDAAVAHPAASIAEITAASHLEVATATLAARQLAASGDLIVLTGSGPEIGPSSLVAGQRAWLKLEQRLSEKLQAFHQAHPLRPGMPRQELNSRLDLPPAVYKVLFEHMLSQGKILEAGSLVSLATHYIELDPQQRHLADELLAVFSTSPYSPPSVKECIARVGEPLYLALVHLGELLPVSGEVVFRRADFEAMVSEVRSYITANGSISVSQARDHFQTTRRYILALLEYMDSLDITQRDGDQRTLK